MVREGVGTQCRHSGYGLERVGKLRSPRQITRGAGNRQGVCPIAPPQELRQPSDGRAGTGYYYYYEREVNGKANNLFSPYFGGKKP
jgi:hypothetical protein